MMISSRGRYALRVMADIAVNSDGTTLIPLPAIAKRQDISLKYLESIMTLLSRGGFVLAAHGKGGGYKLALPPNKCRIGDILRQTEGSLAPVACLESVSCACTRAADCPTLPVWEKLGSLINGYLDSVTLADLI